MRDPSLSDWQPAPVQNHREFRTFSAVIHLLCDALKTPPPVARTILRPFFTHGIVPRTLFLASNPYAVRMQPTHTREAVLRQARRAV